MQSNEILQINIDIFGALLTLRIQSEYMQTQCKRQMAGLGLNFLIIGNFDKI